MGRRKRITPAEHERLRAQLVQHAQETLALGVMNCGLCGRPLNERNGRVVVTGDGRIYATCKPMCPNLSMVDTAELHIPNQRPSHGR